MLQAILGRLEQKHKDDAYDGHEWSPLFRDALPRIFKFNDGGYLCQSCLPKELPANAVQAAGRPNEVGT
jgi:hypothetical protein